MKERLTEMVSSYTVRYDIIKKNTAWKEVAQIVALIIALRNLFYTVTTTYYENAVWCYG